MTVRTLKAYRHFSPVFLPPSFLPTSPELAESFHARVPSGDLFSERIARCLTVRLQVSEDSCRWRAVSVQDLGLSLSRPAKNELQYRIFHENRLVWLFTGLPESERNRLLAPLLGERLPNP